MSFIHQANGKALCMSQRTHLYLVNTVSQALSSLLAPLPSVPIFASQVYLEFSSWNKRTSFLKAAAHE